MRVGVYVRKWMLSMLLAVVGMTAVAQSRSNYTSQGRYELSKGRYVPAIELFNRSIELNRYNSEAYFLRGIAKYELEDFIGAAKDFGLSIELNPKNHEAFLYRGVCQSQLLDYRSAFADFNKALSLNEDDWRIYSNRALASLQLDRYVDVISDCNRIIDLKKATSYTYLLRGEAKVGLEMFNVAISDFDKAIALDSTDMQPVLHRGMTRAKLDQYDKAIVDYERAMEMESENALPLFHRGAVLSEMGKYKEALRDFNSVLERYPDNAIVLFHRAMTLSELGRNKEAMDDYNAVVVLNPKVVLGYYNRAILKSNNKDNRGALADYEKVIELFPEFLEAHENRARVLQIMGNRTAYDRAVADLEQVRLSLAISDDEAHFQQRVKLMKATQLDGDFEAAPQELGKIQHQKVDVQLLPFYRISPFPETEKDISVYDGYQKPYYNIGVLALTASAKMDTEKLTKELIDLSTTSAALAPIQNVKKAVVLANMNDFERAKALLRSEMVDEKSTVAYRFTEAVITQMQYVEVREKYQQMIGGLDVMDTAQQKLEDRLLLEAELAYREVVKLDPNMTFAHFNLGMILVASERLEEAENQFGLAASVRGNFIEANFNRGLIRLILGKTNQGCEDLSLAGELGLTASYNIIKRYCE